MQNRAVTCEVMDRTHEANPMWLKLLASLFVHLHSAPPVYCVCTFGRRKRGFRYNLYQAYKVKAIVKTQLDWPRSGWHTFIN